MKKKANNIRIQLLTYPDCPDADATRQALRRVLAEQGLPVEFEEVDLTSPFTPETLASWGSPTVLVNGKDLTEETPAGPTCRLYENPVGGVSGVPPDDLIQAALKAARPARCERLRSLGLIPGAISSVLPVAT